MVDGDHAHLHVGAQGVDQGYSRHRQRAVQARHRLDLFLNAVGPPSCASLLPCSPMSSNSLSEVLAGAVHPVVDRRHRDFEEGGDLRLGVLPQVVEGHDLVLSVRQQV